MEEENRMDMNVVIFWAEILYKNFLSFLIKIFIINSYNFFCVYNYFDILIMKKNKL